MSLIVTISAYLLKCKVCIKQHVGENNGCISAKVEQLQGQGQEIPEKWKLHATSLWAFL